MIENRTIKTGRKVKEKRKTEIDIGKLAIDRTEKGYKVLGEKNKK